MFVRSFIPVLFLAVLAPPIAATDKSSSLAMKKISCQSSHADIDCHKGTATSISCYVLDECPLRGFKCTRPAEANDKHLLLWAECIDGDDKLLGGGSAGSSNDHHKFSKVVDRFLPKAASHESHFFKTHISPRFAAGNPLIIQQRYAKPGCDPSDLILVEYMPADANCYPETQQGYRRATTSDSNSKFEVGYFQDKFCFKAMNFDNDNSIIKNKIGKCFNRDFSKEAKHSFKFVYVENPEVEEPEPKWDDEEEPRDEL